MHNPNIIVQRFRRTMQDRLGEWQPLGFSWKTPASAGLVSHDVYHHLPGDTGNFAQEVAALGAEWYVDLQPLNASAPSVSRRELEVFERTVDDTVLNALDSREATPFCLPAKLSTGDGLSENDLTYFQLLADIALKSVMSSSDPRAAPSESFTEHFVQGLRWGYEQAKNRFPDQEQVRAGSKALRYELADLTLQEVPYEHEITVTLDGYFCAVTYDDADAFFLASTPVKEAVLMVWCSHEAGYPPKHATLHRSEVEYADYVRAHFYDQEDGELVQEEQLLPMQDQSHLRKVYVKTPELQALLHAGQAVVIPLTAYQEVLFTPREVPVF